MCFESEVPKEPKPAIDQFWMIASNRGPSAARSHSLEEAEAEATRLAKKHPGESFIVLEAVSEFKTQEPPVVKTTWQG